MNYPKQNDDSLFNFPWEYLRRPLWILKTNLNVLRMNSRIKSYIVRKVITWIIRKGFHFKESHIIDSIFTNFLTFRVIAFWQITRTKIITIQRYNFFSLKQVVKSSYAHNELFNMIKSTKCLNYSVVTGQKTFHTVILHDKDRISRKVFLWRGYLYEYLTMYFYQQFNAYIYIC